MQQHKEDISGNRHFQLERMILFSDAVFAIVITLLVIEIKVPEHTEEGMMQSSQLAQSLWHLVPHFIGFIATFLITGMFWQIHHRMFGYVTSYDGALIWLNLFLLLAVCCLPFTASLVSEYGYLNLAYSIYAINLGLISLASAFIWRRISNPGHKLATNLHDFNLINMVKHAALQFHLFSLAARSFVCSILNCSHGLAALFSFSSFRPFLF